VRKRNPAWKHGGIGAGNVGSDKPRAGGGKVGGSLAVGEVLKGLRGKRDTGSPQTIFNSGGKEGATTQGLKKKITGGEETQWEGKEVWGKTNGLVKTSAKGEEKRTDCRHFKVVKMKEGKQGESIEGLSPVNTPKSGR